MRGRALRFKLMAMSALAFGAAAIAQNAAPGTVDATALGGPINFNNGLLFSPGDNPAWSAPGLDDRGWAPVFTRGSEPAAHFPASGFGWYRVHVRLRSDDRDVALILPHGGGGDYEVFANGFRIGGAGSMKPGDAVNRDPPVSYILPPAALAPGHGDLVLAFRFFVGDPQKWPVWIPGFASSAALKLTSAEAAPAQLQELRAHAMAATLTVDLLLGLVGLVSLALYLGSSAAEYLAMGISATCWFGFMLPTIWSTDHRVSPLHPVFWIEAVLFTIASVGVIEFARLLVGSRRSPLLAAAEVLCASGLLLPLAQAGLLSGFLAQVLSPAVSIVVDLTVTLLLLVGSRRGNRDAALLFVPWIAWAIAADLYAPVAPLLNLPPLPSFSLFGYAIVMENILTGAFAVSLLLLIISRSVRLARAKAQADSDLRALQSLQQMLLSRSSKPTPGFRLETVYRPAQEVGGDFFLVSSGEDGSVIAMVGDVSGKGILAAMRVSLILGALNSESSREPAEMLAGLNRVLLQQRDIGFTTACCVRVEANGDFRFANAGHLSPYLGGRELVSPGALPLGLSADQELVTVTGQMQPDERLVLLSDGIPEARSKQQLLGFERLRDLTRLPAEEIAEAAQQFGQEDDITVLTLSLSGAPVSA